MIATIDPRTRIVTLASSCGHQAALDAGSRIAQFDAVAPVDCELDRAPEELFVMLDKWLADCLATSATISPSECAEQVRSRAQAILDTWSLFLPARIAREDLADYIEALDQRLRVGQCWQVYIGVVAAMFWTGVNAAGYFLKMVRMKSGA